MSGTTYRTFGVLAIAAVFLGIWYLFGTPSTVSLAEDLAQFDTLGSRIERDFNQYPLLNFTDNYSITDTLTDGIEITNGGTNNASDPTPLSGPLGQDVSLDRSESEASLTSPDLQETLSLRFPKTLAEPIAVTLSGGRTILVQQEDNTDASASLLNGTVTAADATFLSGRSGPLGQDLPLEESTSAAAPSYLKYTTSDARINTYYAYQKDQAKGYRNLKHWTIFADGDGEESQSYRFQNAHLRLNDRGEVEVRYVAPPDQSVRAQVGDELWARAQAVLAEDLAANIEHTEPDLIIPAPYTIDANGEQVTRDWVVTPADAVNPDDVSGDFILSTKFEVSLLGYPIALDPTLQFTAPGNPEAGSVISGETTSNYFGASLTTGDFNADGRDDLAVGAYGYSSGTGRVYIFYNDSNYQTKASGADVILTGGATSNSFGATLTTGDFNADGVDDLAVGATGYTTFTGRVYIFYGGSMISETVSGADVTLTGGATLNFFGTSLTTGDFNADGVDDLAVGASAYLSNTGRAYIFYGGSMISETVSGADVTLTGVSGYALGSALTTGDFNADGKDDLAVGATGYSSATGRAYIFYGGSMISETVSGADVTLTGGGTSNSFGSGLTTGDFNADGKDDLAVGAAIYSSGTGRVYIFYGGSMISEDTTGADITLTGEAISNFFGTSLTTGDFNADGVDDLAAGAYGYSTNTGRSYIFYGGSMVNEGASGADVILTGETTTNYFSSPLTTGDFNADGKDDLVVGAYYHNSQQGRVYLFYSQSGQVNLDKHITDGATGNRFGASLTTGDFNADGKEDLVVGAPNYSTNTGRSYIFYGYATTSSASGADVTLTGETTNNFFGASLTTGDFNADGKDDLAVGAITYSSGTGRVYIFYGGSMISESASGADVTLTGEGTSNYLGRSLTTGDFNADGKDDLAVGADGYNGGYYGRVYILYNDGSYPASASSADVILTGENFNNFFGSALTTGDFNADGKDDLAVGAYGYSSNTGRAYIFYGGSMITETASGADVILTGESVFGGGYFGSTLTTGDFNADGKDDLAVGASNYSFGAGRAYIFYGGSMISENASGADIVITGDAANDLFSSALTTGDFNADGKDDLAVGAYGYSSVTGRAYIFYGGSMISENASGADIVITGDAANDDYGTRLIVYDYNHDGRDDLLVGAPGYNNGGDTGRVYFYETRENYVWNLQKQSLVDGVRVHPIMGHEMKITGETTNNYFGVSLTTGDFNADGKDDLAVGANGFNASAGRVYIFYNSSSYRTKASGADVTLTGVSADDRFGVSLTTGDFNADGKDDLAVGADGYSTYTGRAYIFYGGSMISENASGADVILTGQATGNYFGATFTTGDFNTDGKDDLAVGAKYYSGLTGRAYVFYGGGMVSEGAAGADVILTGEAGGGTFGASLTTGDFNADGKDDLAVGANWYSTYTGRAYLFYGGSMISESATGADVTLTGEAIQNNFGASLTTGDFNADGKDDLAVGADGYDVGSFTNEGRAYIFYGGSMISENASGADIALTGETTNNSFGATLTTGDFNADGKDDLAVGAYNYSSGTGRAYIFYGGSMISENASGADVILTGQATGNYFGATFTTGDFNADGKDDLAVGARFYNSNQGGVYFYTTNDFQITGETTSDSIGYKITAGDFNADGKTDLAVSDPEVSTYAGKVYLFLGGKMRSETNAGADVILTGESGSYFGSALTTGDFNADGKDDLAVGADGHSTYTGRAYIFYGGSMISENASGADIALTGETTNNSFGATLTTGDFNADGKDDLAVGAYNYSSGTGRAYIFYGGSMISENASGADVILTGQATGNYFGATFTTGDFNADGKDDLAVGAYGYSSVTGRAYIFYGGSMISENASGADVILTGATAGDRFGVSLTTGDFNADGKDDLAVGADGHSTYTGRAYIFYGGSMTSENATGADVALTGETTNNSFGATLTTGDFNADGKDDLAVGAYGYSTNTGRAYLFYGHTLVDQSAGNADIIISGEGTNQYFARFVMASDVDDNGTDDLVVGTYSYKNLGRLYVIMSEIASVRYSQHRFQGTMKIQGSGTFQ